MKIKSVFSALLAASGIAVAATSINPAAAVTTTFGFNNVFPNGGNTAGDAYVNYFTLDVTDVAVGKVLFQFKNAANNTATTSLIRDVAFSFNTTTLPNLLTNVAANVNNLGNVNFNASPTNLPQSNNIPGWVTEVYGGVRRTPGNARGVQPGEILGFQFDANYAQVINALNNGSLDVGIHVISLPGGGSDTFYVAPNSPTAPVPEPITLLGIGLGSAGMGALKRKYGKKETKEKAAV